MINSDEIARRLERDRDINVDLAPKFDIAVEVELNYLEATARPSIDYCNLGNYMKYVLQEYYRALDLKK